MTTGVQAAIRDHNRPLATWEDAAAAHVVPALQGADGSVLVAECGLGRLLAAVVDGVPGALRVMAVDGAHAFVDVARGSLGTGRVPVFFRTNSLFSLGFARDVFSAAVGVRGVATEADAVNALSGLSAVVRPGGRVVVCAVGPRTAQTLADVFSEEAATRGVPRDALDDLASRWVTAEALERAGRAVGLQSSSCATERLDVVFANADAYLADPLVSCALGAYAALEAEAPGVLAGADARLRTYFGADAVPDQLDLIVWAGVVGEPTEVAVDDVDVVDTE